MKKLFVTLTLLAAFVGQTAVASPILKKPFEQIIYVSAYVTSTQSSAYAGVDYTNPKGFFDGDLWTIPAGTVVEEVYAIVDEAVVGLTDFEVGDDDSASGYITYSDPLSSTGLKYGTLGQYGTYLKGSADGNLVSTVASKLKKYYSASGKELKLDVTGTATAGKLRLVVRGYHL